ncbi:MAG TPA: capsule assembly Wzi family protein [Sphingobacteriaceae bacterium]|nr:capsule assembly Wzi family protein [Sphingobacteriaceae bacterium]
MPRLNTQYTISNTLHKVLLIAGLFLITYSAKSQTLPVGTPVLEEYYRRMQLLGKLDSSISFTVRPLSSEALQEEDIFNPVDSAGDRASGHSGIRTFANGKGKFQVLPITLQTQYNSKRPYGWNDGPMIPARGFQTVLSAGVYGKYGPLSIQLRPEVVYAENRSHAFDNYPGIPDAYIDLPDRFGEKSYKKLFPGQSSIRLTTGPVSLGVSSENLWWGPGIQNSLLMSNTAPGFNHFTLNTVKPINTEIGAFEGQLIGGRLEGSGFTDKPDDWRYLSGMTLSYQPRWIPGLFIGFTRSLQSYSKDLNEFSDYIPIFKAFSNKSNQQGQTPSDQLVSVFSRWLWKDANAEIYLEYSRGDHAVNLRDYIIEPEHSRAYLVGFQKLIELPGNRSEYLQLALEGTHLTQSINYSIRNASSVYTHNQIVHGYTHDGQLIGAGIGPGGDLQSLQVNWIRTKNNFGVNIERYVYNNDYFGNSFLQTEGRTYLAFGLEMMRKYKELILNCIIQSIISNDRQKVASKAASLKHNSKGNLQAQLNISYSF